MGYFGSASKPFRPKAKRKLKAEDRRCHPPLPMSPQQKGSLKRKPTSWLNTFSPWIEAAESSKQPRPTELRTNRLLPGPLPMMQCFPDADFLTLNVSVPWSLTTTEGTTEQGPGKEAKWAQHTVQVGEQVGKKPPWKAGGMSVHRLQG